MVNGERTTDWSSNGLVRAAMLAFLVIAGFLSYSNTFHVPFYYDDNGYIKEDPAIRITSLTTENLISAAVNGTPRHRLVPNLTFALNYYFGQYKVYGYHLVNLVIHLACGLILFFLFKYTLILAGGTGQTGRGERESGRSEPGPVWPAFFAVLIWLLHPLNSQSVTYVVQRMTSLVALFYFLSMLFYIKGRMKTGAGGPWRAGSLWYYAGAVISGLLAVISKENAGTLPLFIFLYEWFFFQEMNSAWIKKRLVWIGVAALVFGGIALFYLGENPFQRIVSSYMYRDFTLSQRVMTEWRVVVWYISLIFFPAASRLTLDYDYPLSLSLIHPPTTLLCLGAWIAILVAALYAGRRHRLFSFCLFWYMGNLLIESSVIGIEIIYEHRNYLPSAMIILYFVYLVYDRIKARRVAVAALCIIATLFATWTYQRNQVWNDRVVFWKDNVRKSNYKYRSLYNLALAFYDSGKYEAAINYYQQALKLEPNNPEALNNMGIALAAIGKIEQSISFYKKALKVAPGYVDAILNLGLRFYYAGKYKPAINYYQQALKLEPNNPDALSYMGRALATIGNIEQSIAFYKKAIKVAPWRVEAIINLGLRFYYAGKYKPAINYYQQALKLEPNNPNALNYMGNALAAIGNFEQSIAFYKKAVDAFPGYSKAMTNLGNTLYKLGRFSEAVGVMKKSVAVDPTNLEAHVNLGAALMRLGRLKDAEIQLLAAVRIAPYNAEAFNNLGTVYVYEKRFDEAETEFKKALAISPGYTSAKNNLERLRQMTGR